MFVMFKEEVMFAEKMNVMEGDELNVMIGEEFLVMLALVSFFVNVSSLPPGFRDWLYSLSFLCVLLDLYLRP